MSNQGNHQPNYDELIAYYGTNPTPEQSPLADGSRLLHTLFRPNDLYIVKPERTATSRNSTLLRGHCVLPSIIRAYNANVFLLNPVAEYVAHQMDRNNLIQLGTLEPISKYQNFRFEYDEDEAGIAFSGSEGKIAQLKLLQRADLPTSILLDTGNKSVQVLLSVDGINSLEEYRLIATSILARLPGNPDHKAIEPAQPIWLPGGQRETSNPSNPVAFPKVVHYGRVLSKDEVYGWILRTPIQSPELLTHLKIPAGMVTRALETDRSDEVGRAITEKGLRVVRETTLGWHIFCPFHEDKRSPSAFLYRSGWVHCLSSNCSGGGFVTGKNAVAGVEKAEFSRSMLKEAFELGQDLTDLREERDDGIYIRSDSPIASLFKGRKRLANRLGNENSTAFLVWYGNVKDAAHSAAALRSFGQAAFYGKEDQANYFVCCLYRDAISAHEFERFIAQVIGMGFLATRERPQLQAISSLAEIQGWTVSAARLGPDGKTVFGMSVTEEEIQRALETEPSFWLREFFVDRFALKLDDSPRGYRKLTSHYSRNSKTLSPATIQALTSHVQPVTMEAERHKAEIVEQLSRADVDAEVALSDLAKGGVSVAYLLSERGLEVSGRTSVNHVTPTRFGEVLSVEESRKLPVVSTPYEAASESRSRDLLYIIGKIKASDPNPYVCIVAPAGFGKSTFLEQNLPSEFRALGFQSAIVAKERVDDTLSAEARGNSNVSDHISDLNRSAPKRIMLMGTGGYAASDEAATEDFEDNDRELTDEEWEAMVESIETMSALHKPAVVYSAVTYSPDICIHPDKGPPDKVRPNFCNASCPNKTCRAHHDHRKSLRHQEYIVSTHKAVSDDRRKDLSVFGEVTKRDAVIFDEKPSGVFQEDRIVISRDKISSLDDAIRHLSEKPREEDTFLIENLTSLRSRLLRQLSEAKQQIPRLRIGSKSKKLMRLGRGNLLGVDSLRLYRALRAKASKQSTMKGYNDVMKVAELFQGLDGFEGPYIEIYEIDKDDNDKRTLTICWGKPKWAELRNTHSRTFITMDATAYLDPDYSMPGAPKVVRIVDGKTFPNLTIHTTADKDRSAGRLVADWEEKYAAELKEQIRSIQIAYPGEEILIVTKVDAAEDKVQRIIEAERFEKVHLNHFGNLKGSNEYRDCTHIIFTHVQRWRTENYLLRAIWLEERNSEQVLSKVWTSVANAVNSIHKAVKGFPFADDGLERLRLQYDVPDMIQTIMRTKLRERDSLAKVHVWLPGTNALRIGMLLDYFVGAKVVKDHG